MATDSESETAAFARLVDALEPFLDKLVFVGGWGHRLMALHPSANPPKYDLLTTADVDIATPERISPKAGSILKRLKEAGFSQELSGDFATVSIAGVSAQKLRHLELLFESPWSVTASRRNGFPELRMPRTLQVPNPISYIVQKLFVLPRRRRRDQRAKDVLYVHDTLALFSGAPEALRESWLSVSARMDERTKSKFVKAIDTLFGVLSDDVREAAEIARATGRPNPPTPSQIAAACRGKLLEILTEN